MKCIAYVGEVTGSKRISEKKNVLMCSTKELALIYVLWQLAGLQQHHSIKTFAPFPLSSSTLKVSTTTIRGVKWALKEQHRSKNGGRGNHWV